MNKALFTSTTDVWATPQWFFDELDKEFAFNLDPCALPENAKCKTFYTPNNDGLTQNWGGTTFFAIRRTAERSLRGCESATRKAESRTRSSLCSFQHGRTRLGFTITCSEKARYVSFAGG